MSAIDTYLASNAEYAAGFSKGSLPMPPAKQIAIVACMDARLETGIRPPFAMEAFSDLEDDVRQSMARINASPFLLHKSEIRGFVFEVESGRLREVN